MRRNGKVENSRDVYGGRLVPTVFMIFMCELRQSCYGNGNYLPKTIIIDLIVKVDDVK
jgi:hypothetical protein